MTRKQQCQKVWLYNKADWRGLADYLKPRFDRLDKKYHPTPDELWTEIKTHHLEGMVLYIPRRTTKHKESCPWIDKELHQIIKTASMMRSQRRNFLSVSGRMSNTGSLMQHPLLVRSREKTSW